MNEQTKILIGSITRHTLSAVGAYLAAKGIIGPEDVQGYVEAVVGGILVLVTISISYVAKKTAIESPSRQVDKS